MFLFTVMLKEQESIQSIQEEITYFENQLFRLERLKQSGQDIGLPTRLAIEQCLFDMIDEMVSNQPDKPRQA